MKRKTRTWTIHIFWYAGRRRRIWKRVFILGTNILAKCFGGESNVVVKGYGN